uniref:Uncharacterized protein n=1 Tax=Ditylenchus dipsaci TaxID=166011 RepID=A0A915DRR5_9BILA
MVDISRHRMNKWRAIHHEAHPAKIPTIPPSLYQQAFTLKLRGVKWLQIQGTHKYAVSYDKHMSENDLRTFYNNYLRRSYESWNYYKRLRSSFCIVRPSEKWPNYYECNCLTGSKKVIVSTVYC